MIAWAAPLGFAMLAGLAHTVFRLGRLTQAVEDMARRLAALEASSR